MEEHLAQNGLALGEMKYRLGRKLAFDAASEKFVNDAEADGMLGRPMRGPWQL